MHEISQYRVKYSIDDISRTIWFKDKSLALSFAVETSIKVRGRVLVLTSKGNFVAAYENGEWVA